MTDRHLKKELPETELVVQEECHCTLEPKIGTSGSTLSELTDQAICFA